MFNFFKREQINKSRQKEVDLFRGFTAIVLIMCHVSLYLGDANDTALYVFGDIIGSEFGAPVFMSMMGISMIYTSHNKPIDFFKRGIILFISGYLLNIVRSFIPYLLMPNEDYFSTLSSLFLIDILPFAGLSFMLIALFKKLHIPSYLILVISLVFALIDELLFPISTTITDNNVLIYFLNLFIPIDEYSCFPFLTWFFFPAFGMLLGEILIRTSNKKKLYNIFLIIGSIAVVYVYGSFIYLYPDYTSYYAGENFYYMGVFNLIVNGLLICFGLSIWYYLSKIIPSFIDKYLLFLSKNLNIFYWLSWVVIGTIIHIQAHFGFVIPSYIVIILIFVVQAVTSLLTKVYIDIKNKLLNNMIK